MKVKLNLFEDRTRTNEHLNKTHKTQIYKHKYVYYIYTDTNLYKYISKYTYKYLMK